MSEPPAPGPAADLGRGLAGRYRIEREIGTGGMAVVYLARDLKRDRVVALKVLRPELAPMAGSERFDREIRVSARLVHPNILPLLDSGATAGHLWYTMPFVEGESLRARLEREKQLPFEEALRLTREIADALDHAHAHGVLHRDIKPENILIGSGHALVADFGIARALHDTGDRLTGTGFALGTPGYMSPEQSSGATSLDRRSDLYALASVCYEMLAGEPPFTGPTAQAVIARRLSQPAPSVRTIRPSIPERADDVLRRALAPIPADRFASCGDFVQALADAGVAPQGRIQARGRRSLILGGMVLLGVAALVVKFLARRPAVVGSDRAAGEAIRLAVLPFRLIGGDSADRYLAEGITEEVSSALSNLGGLRVIDRGSVTSYARSGTNARDIGAALAVDALVDGDVQKAGDAIRVRVKLVETATGESKWSQTYDHTSLDVFRVQSEVATRVSSVLRIQLAERESRALQRPPTTNPEAYDAYLRARSFDRFQGVSGRNRVGLDSMIANLTRAVQLDSGFASAWASLAAELVSAVFLFDADPVLLDRADHAIRTSLGLDSTVAMAWKARADLKWNAIRGWYFRESLFDLRHAIALQPSLVIAHSSLGSLYFHYGFLDQARRELEESLSLDPRDGCDDPTRCLGFSRPRLARVMWYEQKFDSALAVYQTIPFLGGFSWEKALVLGAVGRADEGLALIDSMTPTTGSENGDRDAVRGLLYAISGRSRLALAHIGQAVAAPNSRSHFHHAQFVIACTYARLGRKREAVEWLRRTADNGMPNYPLFRNDPNLRSLQGDPEYERLMTTLQQQFETNRRLVDAPMVH